MPTQEVAPARCAAALLGSDARRRGAVLLDGGGPASWLHGEMIYADRPAATLEVFASGWGRWTDASGADWRWGDPLDQWERFLAAGCAPEGGLLTVLSYDLKHWVERLPRRHRWLRLPLLYAARYDWSYRADYRAGTGRLRTAREDELIERLHWYETAASAAPPVPAFSGSAHPLLSRRAYADMLARAQEYIAAGDVYEINLAQPFVAPARPGDAPALFAAWSARYPMPFAAYVDGGTWALVSNSPECLLHADGAWVAAFPIKGTRRAPPGADIAALAAQLAADIKEQAEHVMVVDLERNDLGRVCEPGSVAVAEFAAAYPYPALVHLVSEVRGKLRPGTGPAALLRAMFPGGSVTGAPKVRAMQLIEELECGARGFYTGAIGWTEAGGDSRFNIAIRTAVLAGSELTYWAGGGIVADSDPEREYEETLWKSETLFRALTEGGTEPA